MATYTLIYKLKLKAFDHVNWLAQFIDAIYGERKD